ncbi:MAG: PadR family transcriptional regulator [bacterium]
MDIQLKRGMLDVCVLRSLVNEDSYGYKIIKDVSNYIEISESTLYPILKRLETSNAVTFYSVEHNGRLRKYYSITNIGKEKLIGFINDWNLVTNVFKYISGGAENE